MKTSSDSDITTQELDSRQVRLTIEVPEERLQEEMRRAAQLISREVTIPGFRKGKAPYDIVVQRYGEEMIREEAVNLLIEPIYREALEQEGILPYAPAALETMALDPLRYTFLVPLPPQIELGDYQSLRIDPPTVVVEEEEIEKVLEQVREQHAVLEPVDGREAQPGDVLSISVEARSEDGTIFLKDEEVEVLLDLENDYPTPGFYEALVGMAPGEERTFRLEMPDAHPSDEAEFTVAAEEIFERILPGLDDDLARAVGNFDSLEAMRARIEGRIRERKQAEADEEYSLQVIDALVEGAELKYPPEALEEEVDEFLGQEEERTRRTRRMSLEDYLKAIGKTEEELREELRPRAEQRLQRSLALMSFVEAEGLSVTEEEVERRIAVLSEGEGSQADEIREQLQSEEMRRIVESNLLIEKATARLTAIARGEEESEG
ncbi:MAG: trigger factor [Anaerolineae bacterium]